MGDVRVNGAPILEDLGAHYTPVQKQAYALSTGAYACEKPITGLACQRRQFGIGLQ